MVNAGAEPSLPFRAERVASGIEPGEVGHCSKLESPTSPNLSAPEGGEESEGGVII